MGFKYSVAALTLGFLGYNAYDETEEVFKAINEAGYDGIDLFDIVEKRDAARLKQASESTQLKIPEIMGNWGGPGKDLACEDSKTREQGIQYAKELINLCVELNSPTLGYCLCQPTVPEACFSILPVDVLKTNLVHSLKIIGAYAADRGINIVIEPLNCYESYPCMMNTVEQALGIIEEVGVDSIGVQPDVFHMNIGESSIPNALRLAGKRIKHIHMNETNHFAFGSGHADVKTIFCALKEIDFDGYITVYMPMVSRELFNMTFRGIFDQNQVPAKADLKSHLTQTIDYLKDMEAQV